MSRFQKRLKKRRPLRWAPLLVLFLLATGDLTAQNAADVVRVVVQNELNADLNDQSLWMYRVAKKKSGNSIVQLGVETSQGDLFESTEKNGSPLTPQEHQADLNRIDRLVNSPSALRKLRANSRHDDQQARELAELLPDAFLWETVEDRNGELLLSFRPNPQFRPPNMNAKAMEAVTGTMLVDKRQMRLKRIIGKLSHSVTFGWGLLGKLDAGGTCDVSRAEVAPGEWRIDELHLHISGRMLMFYTIGFQEDDVFDDFHPVPGSVDLKKAEEMFAEGTVARLLAVRLPPGW